MRNLSSGAPAPHPLWSMVLGALLLAQAGCGELLEEQPVEEFPVGVRVSELQDVCSVPVRGHGTVDMETDYIPGVLACESAAGASLETLKSQAIAARTYAVFKLKVENQRELINSQANQVYKCSYATPQAIHRQAARETAGQVITHNGLVTAAFFVAGARPTTNSCIPSAQDVARNDPTNTERHVTYNEGRSGSNLRRAQSPIGHPANPHNVGVMSQEGAKCLGAKGRSAMGILRFYYGDGIRLETMSGCNGSQPVQPSQPTQPEPSTVNPDAGQCQTNDQAPTIVPRSAWGARAPKCNRSAHTPNRLTIHHTEQGPNHSGPAAVRSVQQWHLQRDGGTWCDIGYHYLIDRDGTIYAGNPENRQGAHVLNQNAGNVGIALIGSFQNEQVSSAQQNAAVRMVKWLSKKHNIPLNRNSIKGHGERMATDCPGGLSVDRIVQMAGSDIICDEQPQPNDPNIEPMYEYELPDLAIETDLIGYKYLRITHTGEGGAFPVDGVYHETGNGQIWANSASGSAQNASAATGPADLTKCADLESKAALIIPGGQLTLEFPTGLQIASGFFIRGQAVTNFPDECNQPVDGRAKIEASLDGRQWDLLLKDSTSNTSASVPGLEFDFVTPVGNTAPVEATFQVQASPEVVKVAYYAEKYPLGTSTTPGDKFKIEYKFQGKGKRLISAWGYNKDDKIVAKAERYITITDGLAFIAPTEGNTYPPAMSMEVATEDAITRVVYSADGTNLGESTSKAANFRINYTFNMNGKRKLLAIGYDASGNEVSRQQIEITIDPNGASLRFTSPRSGGRFKTSDEVPFSVESTSPQIVKVQYMADGKWDLGSSTNRSSQYALKYKFNQLGSRKIDAIGFDAENKKVATATLSLFVTDDNGTVPDGGSSYDPSTDPTNPGPGADNPNASLAERLARAASVVDGRRSGGRCWAGVKTAFEAAGVSRPAGYNGPAYLQLGGVGPCTSYNFQLSAYCFGRNAAANPRNLFEAFQLERVNISPTQAQRGDLIVWDRGCNGYNATHGHIEVALGDGRACSDYCGRIKPGGDSCSWVFRPVSSRSTGGTSNQGNMNPNGGDPNASPGTPAGKFWITYFYKALESEFSGADDTAIKDTSCNTIKMVPSAYARSLCIEGSGKLDDGRIVNYGRSCSCNTGCSYCYTVLDASRFPWGMGNRNNPLVPLRSLAVDTSVVANGTLIYLKSFDGLSIPSVDGLGGFTHDGCFRADDVGGAIKGNHFDVFSGTPGMRRALEQLLPTRTNIDTWVRADARCAHLK